MQVRRSHLPGALSLVALGPRATRSPGALWPRATWDPTDIAGCVLWLRADMGITLSGADVTAWADQSGAGHNAVQAVAADMPAYSAVGGPSGRPAVDFDRANTESMYWPTTTFTDPSTNYTVFGVIVQRNVATITTQTLFSWYDGIIVQSTTPVTNVAGNVGGYDNVAWRQVAAAVNGAQILTWQLRDATNDVEVWRDGVSLGTTGWSSQPLTDGGGTNLVRLGAAYISTGQNLDAALAEIIVYNSVLSAGNLAAVHAYLSALYGL